MMLCGRLKKKQTFDDRGAQMILSIIVPVYNVEIYLSKCIESIIQNQSQEIEIILINDGSPDNCGEICDSYAGKDGRIKVIHKANGGVSSARNAGIDAAKGKYIWFVDADDWIEPTSVETMIENIKTIGADLYIFSHKRIMNSDVREVNVVDKVVKLDRDFNLQGFIRDYYFTYKIGFTPWNKVYRREIIEKNRLRFDLQESFGEDLLFNLQYYLHIKNVYISNLTIYNYFVRDGSLERTPSKERHIQQMRLFEKFIYHTKQMRMEAKSVREIVSILFFIHLVSGINQSKASGLKVKKIKGFLREIYKKSYVEEVFQDTAFYTALNKWLEIEGASVPSRIKFRLFSFFWKQGLFHLASIVILK